MRNFVRVYPMIVLLLPLVAAILLWDTFRSHEAPCDEPTDLAFVLCDGPKPTAKCERFEAKVIARWDTAQSRWNAWHDTQCAVYLYLQRDTTNQDTLLPQIGDTLLANTTIEWNRRFGRAFVRRPLHILPAGKKHTVPLQKRLYNRLAKSGLSGNELATVGALTLGYKEDLDPEVKHHFQASGAAHVLAVSGLHTGIIYGLLIWILTLGGRFKPMFENKVARTTISLIIIGFMWGYAWLTGMTPSVVRAVCMVSIFEISRILYRQAFSLNSVALAAVLILMVHPTDLWSVSFQLSFAATFAIIIFAREMERHLHSHNWKQTGYMIPLDWICGTIIISIAAQLGTLPITMFYFGQISNYFLLTNLIVLPLATILVPFGLASIALGGTALGVFVSKGTWALAWLMNHSVAWLESLPGSTTQVHIGAVMVLIYYVLFLNFCWVIAQK